MNRAIRGAAWLLGLDMLWFLYGFWRGYHSGFKAGRRWG
jgi:hypothetical protein